MVYLNRPDKNRGGSNVMLPYWLWPSRRKLWVYANWARLPQIFYTDSASCRSSVAVVNGQGGLHV